MPLTKWTSTQASRELGVDRKTIENRLGRFGIEGEKQGNYTYYTVKELIDAIYGNKEFHLTRKAAADAESAEFDLKERRKELVNRKVVNETVGKWLVLAAQTVDQCMIPKSQKLKIKAALKSPKI